MKRFISCLLLFALAISLSACGGPGASKTYSKAQNALVNGDYEKAAELFESINSYEDSSKLALYSKALLYGEQKNFARAIETLDFLGEYKDSLQLKEYYKYCDLADSKKMDDLLYAAELFDSIAAFRDSASKAEECKNTVYTEAISRFSQGDYVGAQELFTELGSYKDSAEQLQICNDAIKEKILADTYAYAENSLLTGNYDDAISGFKSLGQYDDSPERVYDAIEAKAEYLILRKEYDEAVETLKMLNGRRNSDSRIAEIIEKKNSEIYEQAVKDYESGAYTKAVKEFESIIGYKDSETLISKCEEKIVEEKYVTACSLMEEKNYMSAIECFESILDYKDSMEKAKKCLGSLNIRNINTHNDALLFFGRNIWRFTPMTGSEIENVLDEAGEISSDYYIFSTVGLTYRIYSRGGGLYELQNSVNSHKDGVAFEIIDGKCKQYDLNYKAKEWRKTNGHVVTWYKISEGQYYIVDMDIDYLKNHSDSEMSARVTCWQT